MSSEKQGLTCELCGKGPFKSLAGLAGHAWLAHQVRPGGGLAGVEGKQLVEGQKQLDERIAKLEASVSSQAGKLVEAMPKLLGEGFDKLLAAHRQQLIEVVAELVEGEDELGERMTKLEAALGGMDKIVLQAGKLVEALSKQFPEQLNKLLAAQGKRQDERHQEVLEQLEDLEQKFPPSHIRAG